VRGSLQAAAPIARVRRGYGTARGCDESWQALATIGALGLLADEIFDGAGGDMVDVAVVAHECGRAIYPGPFETSAVGATWLLTRADDMAAYLRALVRGEAIATFALHHVPGSEPRIVTQSDSDRERLTGTATGVIAGTAAGLFVLEATDDRSASHVYLVEAGEHVTTDPEDALDGSRPTATVSFADAPAHRLTFTGPAGDASSLFEQAVDRTRTALALDAVGTAELALELTVAYAHERVAFGRPIGSFQAVQHLCADMLRSVELARAAAQYAAWALDHVDGTEARRAVLQAAAFCCDELPRLGASAIQIFGGIGFTWEHDIQLAYKRLVSAGALLGTADDHYGALGDLVL
jgi:alkylation response protein AidB-like acyl-CoA dehydrogenase